MNHYLKEAERVSDEYITDLIRAAADAENRLAELDDREIPCGELRTRITKLVGHIETVRARERFLQKHPNAYDKVI